MMVYVDDELLGEVCKTGTRNVRTLNDEHGVVRFRVGVCGDVGRRDDVTRARQTCVGNRHFIAHDNVNGFVQGA
jgi:hypothetical protein